MRPGVMVKGGGHPALRIVAVRTRCLPGLGELAVMGIFVTIFADLRRVLELYFLFADRHLVTITALDGAMCSEQREFGFRMVEAIHVRPGPYVMAGFASLRRAVGAQLRLLFLIHRDGDLHGSRCSSCLSSGMEGTYRSSPQPPLCGIRCTPRKHALL